MAPRILQAVEAAHSESIWSVSWSGDLLATGGNDDTVRVWTVAAGGAAGTHVRPLHTLHGPALGVAAAALSRPSAEAAGAPLLVAGSMDSRVHVWNARSGEALGEVPAGPLEGWAATVAPAARCALFFFFFFFVNNVAGRGRQQRSQSSPLPHHHHHHCFSLLLNNQVHAFCCGNLWARLCPRSNIFFVFLFFFLFFFWYFCCSYPTTFERALH
jgi:WD40 repeat protein